MTSSLSPDIDPTRTAWCFLTVRASTAEKAAEISYPQITDWQLGIGNPTQLATVHSHSSESETDDDAIDTLSEILAQHQHDDILLVSPSRATIRLVRTDLAVFHLRSESTTRSDRSISDPTPRPSLHGFRYLCLQETLHDYFTEHKRILREVGISLDQGLVSRNQNLISPATMWRLTRSIHPLLPIDIATGEPI